METLKTIITVILIFGVPIGLYVWISSARDKQKTERLKEEGKIVPREGDALTQRSVFITKIQNISEIGNIINQANLLEEHISFKTEYNAGMIIFQRSGGFRASLRSAGQVGEFYRYIFQTESFKAYKNSNMAYSSKTTFAADVILTAIEKAIFQLDSDTKIELQNINFS